MIYQSFCVIHGLLRCWSARTRRRWARWTSAGGASRSASWDRIRWSRWTNHGRRGGDDSLLGACNFTQIQSIERLKFLKCHTEHEKDLPKKISLIWRCPKTGVPPVIIHFRIFNDSHSPIYGVPGTFMETSPLDASWGQEPVLFNTTVRNNILCPPLRHRVPPWPGEKSVEKDVILVGGNWLPSIWHFPITIGLGTIIPIDEVIFFRGVAQPPTSYSSLSLMLFVSTRSKW